MRPEVPAKHTPHREKRAKAYSAINPDIANRRSSEDMSGFCWWGVPGVSKRAQAFSAGTIFASTSQGTSAAEYGDNEVIFWQGDASDAAFYLRKGNVKLTVVSGRGKEAVIGILDSGSFLGEACLQEQVIRTATARAIRYASVIRIEKEAMLRMLRENPRLSELLISHLLVRNIRIEEDLADHLFHSAEKRLARVLLLLARARNETSNLQVIPKITQEMLAEMVGTTRGRINYFMNKFRRLGLIEYNGVFRVHSSLFNVVLRD